MTRGDRNAKKAARAEQRSSGGSYSSARRATGSGDRSHLVPQVITDVNGVQRTVYVKPSDAVTAAGGLGKPPFTVSTPPPAAMSSGAQPAQEADKPPRFSSDSSADVGQIRFGGWALTESAVEGDEVASPMEVEHTLSDGTSVRYTTPYTLEFDRDGSHFVMYSPESGGHIPESAPHWVSSAIGDGEWDGFVEEIQPDGQSQYYPMIDNYSRYELHPGVDAVDLELQDTGSRGGMYEAWSLGSYGFWRSIDR